MSLTVIDGGRSDDWSDASEVAPEDTWRTIDLPAERAVLSGVMLGLLAEVRPWLEPSDFSSEAHRRSFEAAIDVDARGEAVNIVAVASELRVRDRLKQVGVAYLTEVLNAAPALAPTAMRAYGRTVRDLAVRRALRDVAIVTRANVEHGTARVDALLADARARVEELERRLADNERSIRADAVMARAWQELTRADGEGESQERATGFAELDALLAGRGLPADLTIIGALPAIGKTSFASAVALSTAKRGVGVYFVSLETDEMPIATRLACAEAAVSLKRALDKALSGAEWSRLAEAFNAIAPLPIYTDCESVMSVRDVWERARRIQLELARGGRRLGLVVVDYCQLLKEPSRARKRHEAVAANVRALKSVARELGCAVLALSQLNGASEDRKDRRPEARDLAESAELRRAARLVLMLHKSREPNRVEVIVAKQSNGPQDLSVMLGLDPESLRFFDREGW